MPRKHAPREVIPEPLARALGRDRYWFVIGGHAVRCFCPYRPSRDVDFGVGTARDLDSLLGALSTRGSTAVTERSTDTVHLRFDGVDVSIFLLPKIAPHARDNALTAEAILATKLHAILDRGTRRDFFDLYVIMQQERFGIVECLSAMRTVYDAPVNEDLMLRALAYFDDAAAEAPLPGEGPNDWREVRSFFVEAAGALVSPPTAPLAIQRRVVDVRAPSPSPKSRTRRPKNRRRG